MMASIAFNLVDSQSGGFSIFDASS